MKTGLQLPDFSFETKVISQNLGPVAGVDEVGRGPLAGPVVAAAVVLDADNIPGGLDDSKRLTAAKRESAFEHIMASALAVALASTSAEEIDRTDIRKASLAAMTRAVLGLAHAPGFALVDGRDVPPNLPCPAEAIIKGDSRSQSIAAASIIAKVMRDRMMERVGKVYASYGFQSNAGYGTALHRSAVLSDGGIERIHRFTFAPLRNLAEEAAEA